MLVLRDVIFGNRRHFRELLQGSEEGIAPHPQQRAQAARRGGPAHPEEATRGQRAVYALTEAGIQTLPVMVAMGNWGLAHRDGIREPAGACRAAPRRRSKADRAIHGRVARGRPRHPLSDPDRSRESEQLQGAYEAATTGDLDQ